MSALKTPGSCALHPHLFSALLASLLGHGLLLLSGAIRLPPPPPKPLTVDLRPAETIPAEPLLKNTLAAPEPEKEKPIPPPPKPEKVEKGDKGPAAAPSRPAKTASRDALATAQRKISKLIYYPPEAVAAGLEGEVRLLISLDPATGRILDVDIAATSGHAVLDKAATRAAWAMGSLEGADKKEMILPVMFRLR
jgi:protein TonB